mgnify:CR=1 FL=1|jgi:hypothetical protein|tara:strand:+ start:793 stop:999 length:207 start_codon:yes stop_codon:yes gene_type:complete
MTEFTDDVLKRKEILEEETKDKKVRSLYLHKTKDENYFQTTFQSDRVLIEHKDKRKKNQEFKYGEDVE